MHPHFVSTQFVWDWLWDKPQAYLNSLSIQYLEAASTLQICIKLPVQGDNTISKIGLSEPKHANSPLQVCRSSHLTILHVHCLPVCKGGRVHFTLSPTLALTTASTYIFTSSVLSGLYLWHFTILYQTLKSSTSLFCIMTGTVKLTKGYHRLTICRNIY